MDSVKDDPELAREVITLLGKELKSARERIKELEAQIQHRAFRERAEAAENSVGLLNGEIEKINEENKALKMLLDARVKEEVEGNHSIPPEVERHDELNSDLGRNRLKELEEALQVYYGKYKAQKEAKKILRESLTELETQVKDMTQENEQLRQAPGPELGSTSKPSEAMPVKQPPPPGRREFKTFMAKFPQIQERPHYLHLRPVCNRGVDIEAYLDSDSKLAKFSNSFLYLPGRLLWCGSDSQHGLAFGPQYVFDVKTSRWKKKSTFEARYGEKFHLFYGRKNWIFYAGIYACHNLRSWSPEGSPVPTEKLNPDVFVEPTLENSDSVDGSELQKFIQQLYIDQVLKVEVMGLQCIGFNAELYEALDRRFQASQPVSRKREGSQLEGGHPTKKHRSSMS